MFFLISITNPIIELMSEIIVTQIIRNYHDKNSVDRIYNNLNPILSNKISLQTLRCPFPSNGFINKIKNILWINKINTNLIHLTGDINYLAIFLRKPFVITILDLGMPGRFSSFKSFFYQLFWLKIPINKANTVIAISNKIKNDLIKISPKDKNKIITIYVPLESIYKYSNKNSLNHKVTLLHIATSLHNKNTLRVLMAIQGLKNIKIRIIGKLSIELINFLNKNEIDYYNNFNISDSDMLKEYINADLVVFPSLYEGFGMPIIEAQAIGRVVLTSSLEPMLEIASNAAIFVNPFDFLDIRKGIIKYIENKENLITNLTNKGLVNVNRFNVNIIADQLYNIYLSNSK